MVMHKENFNFDQNNIYWDKNGIHLFKNPFFGAKKLFYNSKCSFFCRPVRPLEFSIFQTFGLKFQTALVCFSLNRKQIMFGTLKAKCWNKEIKENYIFFHKYEKERFLFILEAEIDILQIRIYWRRYIYLDATQNESIFKQNIFSSPAY